MGPPFSCVACTPLLESFPSAPSCSSIILISNATAIRGPTAYAHQVRFLANLPLVFFPGVLRHLDSHLLPWALRLLYLVSRRRQHRFDYPWAGNWMYAAQRWTGGIAFAYILWHTWTHALHRHRSSRFTQTLPFGRCNRNSTIQLCSRFTLSASSPPRGTLPTASGCSAPSGALSPGEGAATVPACVPGILPLAERGGPGNFVHFPARASTGADRRIKSCATRHRTEDGRPVN